MTAHAASHVYFGLNPMWVSTCILAITYAVIMSEKVNRAIVALAGAGVMIIVGVLDQEEAIKGVDWNTLGLLTGMMILVSISRRSGMFEFVAVWSARAAKAHPAGIMLLLQVATAVLSALLDNVTTVLLIVPVTLAITSTLKVPPYPLSVRRDHGLQHRRHRHADRRPAQHHHRLAGRPHLQRFRLSPHAGDRGHPGGADHHDPRALGPGPARDAGSGSGHHGHAPARLDQGLAAAQAVAGRAHRR